MCHSKCYYVHLQTHVYLFTENCSNYFANAASVEIVLFICRKVENENHSVVCCHANVYNSLSVNTIF